MLAAMAIERCHASARELLRNAADTLRIEHDVVVVEIERLVGMPVVETEPELRVTSDEASAFASVERRALDVPRRVRDVTVVERADGLCVDPEVDDVGLIGELPLQTAPSHRRHLGRAGRVGHLLDEW